MFDFVLQMYGDSFEYTKQNQKNNKKNIQPHNKPDKNPQWFWWGMFRCSEKKHIVQCTQKFMFHITSFLFKNFSFASGVNSFSSIYAPLNEFNALHVGHRFPPPANDQM